MKDYIEKARKMAREMIKLEARGSGDTDNAMVALSGRHSLPYQMLWTLRYRPAKSYAYDLIVMLQQAYRDECRRHGAALMIEAQAGLNEEGLNATDRTLLLAAHSSGREAEGEAPAGLVERRQHAGGFAAA